MSAQSEIWRVSTPEGVFEADLETLRQWIAENCVMPTDQVCKGNLHWIEAGRVPLLRSAFENRTSAAPSSSAQTSTTEAAPPAQGWQPQQEAWQSEPEPQNFGPENFNNSSSSGYTHHAPPPPLPPHFSGAHATNACHNHPHAPAKYICRVCSTLFCAECPNFIGTSKIPLCPLCGDLCKLFEEVRSKAAQAQFRSSGFGFEDFGRSFSYPFKHLVPLLFGAMLYGFLLLAGFWGHIFAYVLMFGCMAHVINQLSCGRINCSFMPDFSSFSLWDDLCVPLGLGIGITIVSWGPAIVLAVVLLFSVLGNVSNSMVGKINEMKDSQTMTPEDMRDLQQNGNVTPERARELEEKMERLTQKKPSGERVFKPQEEGRSLSPFGPFTSLIHINGFLLLLLIVAACWAIFYYPMALTVAGYTQSLASIVNPAVGLDAIRRMGATYFKAFGMVFVIEIISSVIGIIVMIITSPFSLPLVGNLPANFLDGTFTFYFNLVIASILGLALFKSADKLGIQTD
ncbi:MAG: hypothetical protein WBP93_00855 [Pyrinomonadaceae bacterium]